MALFGPSYVARLVRWFSRHVLRHRGEHCHRCGWQVAWGCPSYWLAPDELWITVEGGEGGLRCVRCFTHDCDEAGIPIHWRAVRGV